MIKNPIVAHLLAILLYAATLYLIYQERTAWAIVFFITAVLVTYGPKVTKDE